MKEVTFQEFEQSFNLQFNICSNDLLRTPLSRNLSIENMMQKFDTVAHLLVGKDVYSQDELRRFIENKHLLFRNFDVLKKELFNFLKYSCNSSDERAKIVNTGFFKEEIASYTEALQTGVFLATGITKNVFVYVVLPDMGLTPPDVIKVAIAIARVYYGETIEPDYFDCILGRYDWKKMTGEMMGAACLDAAVDHYFER